MTTPVPFSPLSAAGPATMSSVEIADLTGKRHDHVVRDIRKMLDELGDPSPHFWGKGMASGGRPMIVANLPRRECLILVSGYSLPLRARIIDRWEELERVAGAGALPDLSNPEVLRGLLASYADDKAVLQAQVAASAPKVAALELIAEADGSLCVTDAAKALQVQPKVLFRYLRGNGWIYRRAGAANEVGYQGKVALGYLEHKVTRLPRSDGPDRIAEQVRITPKGLARLADLMASAQPHPHHPADRSPHG